MFRFSFDVQTAEVTQSNLLLIISRFNKSSIIYSFYRFSYYRETSWHWRKISRDSTLFLSLVRDFFPVPVVSEHRDVMRFRACSVSSFCPLLSQFPVLVLPRYLRVLCGSFVARVILFVLTPSLNKTSTCLLPMKSRPSKQCVTSCPMEQYKIQWGQRDFLLCWQWHLMPLFQQRSVCNCLIRKICRILVLN